MPTASEIQSRDSTEACWESLGWLLSGCWGEEGCHIVFIQQMFAECWVCGAGREGRALAASVGGQEAQREGGGRAQPREAGSAWQPVPGGQDSASGDR